MDVLIFRLDLSYIKLDYYLVIRFLIMSVIKISSLSQVIFHNLNYYILISSHWLFFFFLLK